MPTIREAGQVAKFSNALPKPGDRGAAPRIDAHHHLWRYTPEEYEWIGEEISELRRDFLLDELRSALRDAGVDGTVVVQARQTVEETQWLLSLAATEGSPIRGVVGWLPLAEAGFAKRFKELLGAPALKGVRHVVQAEQAGFLDGEAFDRGVRVLGERGLVYDLLIFPGQMEEATRFADRHPEQSFVLDHMAKPGIRAGEMSLWSKRLREMARRPNVTCKLSGLVTEANPARWTAEQLLPYVETALEAFGPKRLMVGTDWPVLTVGCEYAQWWQLVEGWTAGLSGDEREEILGKTAVRVYQLDALTGSASEFDVTRP